MNPPRYDSTRSSSADGPKKRRLVILSWLLPVVAVTAVALGSLIETTLEDFHVSGTQVGDVNTNVIFHSDDCLGCHGDYDPPNEPYATWKGSLMGQAGRDPLFYAQLATANQDAADVGNFCLRCHMPMAIVTGHALQPDGSTLDHHDEDGVNCHFCHSMVDPVYKPGVSPPEDLPILNAMGEAPKFYANAMFVLDPTGTRRGPRVESQPMHQVVVSPFHRRSELCGTCHDVGNVAVSRLANGTYAYNALDERTPDENPHAQFPLERTYTEWRLSDFGAGPVEMGGRFGGEGITTVSTCQDCHMPRVNASASFWTPPHKDMARHEFAGAAAPVLDLIGEHYRNDPAVDPQMLARGRERAVSMLQRAASLELSRTGATLHVRVINETGHKLPTGHIEGRRVWINVRFLDRGGNLAAEHGYYDRDEAWLEEDTTTVYEMHVGLSEEAARITTLPPGRTTHMALADVIEKDNRIPPRGFDNAAFEAAGAPVVGAAYADGQHWDDVDYPIPPAAARAEVTLYYQNLPREYIEALRDGNHSNHWGETLHDLWLRTGKGEPIAMTAASLEIRRPVPSQRK